MTKDEAVNRKGVAGQHSQFLVDLIRERGFRRVAEVGVFDGATAKLVLEQLSAQLELYLMVDQWRPFGKVKDAGCPAWKVDWEKLHTQALALTESYPCAVVMRQSSVAAASLMRPATFDLVFIDADHSYEAVKEDIASWLPKVKAGGILAGHDYWSRWLGVVKAVDEAFPFEVLKFLPDSIWYFEKPGRLGGD